MGWDGTGRDDVWGQSLLLGDAASSRLEHPSLVIPFLVCLAGGPHPLSFFFDSDFDLKSQFNSNSTRFNSARPFR